MDDLAGLLILLGLAVLSVPVMLVVALFKIGNAKQRIEALEREMQRMQTQLRTVESASRAAAQARAPAATVAEPVATASRPAAPVRPQSTTAETASMPPASAEAVSTDTASEAAASLPAASTDAASTASPPAVEPLQPAADAPRASSGPPPLPPEFSSQPQPPPRYSPSRAQPQSPREPIDPLAPAFRLIRRWFTEGNVPVKIGVMVLFFGVAALLKYAADQGWVRVPMEFRLAGIAAAAIAGLVFAWRQRERRRTFALSLQGGAIGVLMLVVFAAYRIYDGMLPAGPAFAITIALVAGLGALAVLQNAMALAVLGILAGFMAPIWLSTGSGNHVALFSYYAVLNLGIVAIAWARAWRPLNLLGFAFTFGIGTLWGLFDYRAEKFASTEPFLILFFVLYLSIPLLYARSRAALGHGHRRHDLVDGTLVFGTPLVCFALQAGLLHGYLPGERMPVALSALILAAVYALLAAALRQRERYAALMQSYAVLAVGFATLAVPLALSARATASVFALEGAALVWLGLRQQRRLPQLAGLALQLLAAFAFVAAMSGLQPVFDTGGIAATPPQIGAALVEARATPIANATFMSALLIALAGFATAWAYRRALDAVLVGLMTLWALGWWTFAGLHDIERFAPNIDRLDIAFAFLIVTGWLCAEAWRRLRELPVLTLAVAVALALGLPFALAQTLEFDHPFRDFGLVAWALYALLGWRSLICLRDDGGVRGFAHAGWYWAWIAALASFALQLTEDARLGDGWGMAAVLAPLLAFAAGLRLRPQWIAPPLRARFDDYRGALTVSVASVLGLFWLGSLFFPGDSDPLPWLAVVNPLELTQLLALGLLAHWAWTAQAEARSGALAPQWRVAMFTAAAFAWITIATLRAAHHWGDVAWSLSMLSSTVVQTALTVVWSVLGVLGWIFGSRRGDRLLWGAGAALMAVVLLKLVLIDRTHLGNLFGIVSFLAYGLLCTAVGYFAPAPPRRPVATEASA